MKEDRDFDYKPSVDNLIKALSKNISSHSKSFTSYKEHISKIEENVDKEYRLVIFIEDSTEAGYIVKKRAHSLLIHCYCNKLLIFF